MHRITVSQSAVENASSSRKIHDIPKLRHVEYNTLDLDTLAEIRNMASVGEYGSKIQTLAKHLLWLKEHQHGSKSIVFSAWADSLNIVAHALDANGIEYLRMDSSRAQRNPAREFCNNPKYQVLLLHGYAHNLPPPGGYV